MACVTLTEPLAGRACAVDVYQQNWCCMSLRLGLCAGAQQGDRHCQQPAEPQEGRSKSELSQACQGEPSSICMYAPHQSKPMQANACGSGAWFQALYQSLNGRHVTAQPKWVAFTGGSSAKVDAPGGSGRSGRALTDYLALPVSQYSLLDESLVERSASHIESHCSPRLAQVLKARSKPTR